jgi:hypothetical protein
VSVFRARYTSARTVPQRQRAVYRVVSGPRPRPWLGTMADLAEVTDLTPRDAREGLLGLMKRECVHVVGTEEGGLRVFVLRPLPR